MATFLAYTPPAAGHAFPLVPGLLELQRRGHTVHVRTGPTLVGALSAAGIDAAGIDERIEALLADAAAAGEVDRGANRRFANVVERGGHECEDLERAVAEVRPDVLLVDSLAYGANVAADASGLPWASVVPSLLALTGKGIPPYGLGLSPARGPIGWARDRVLWRVVIRAYSRGMLPGVNSLRADSGLAAFASPLEYVVSADRVIVLTGDPLEYPRASLPAHVRMVGAQSE